MQWISGDANQAGQANPAVWQGGVVGDSVIRSGTMPAAIELADFKIIRRNGSVVAFEPSKISVAITKAFLAVAGGQGAASARVRELVEKLTQSVVYALTRSKPSGGTFHIEDIQDAVELALMRSGEHETARSYVLYRERRAQERAAKLADQPARVEHAINVTDSTGVRPLDKAYLRNVIEAACAGLGQFVSGDRLKLKPLKTCTTACHLMKCTNPQS